MFVVLFFAISPHLGIVVGASPSQIAGIVLVVIGFPFKADAPVGLPSVAQTGIVVEPLHAIPQQETHIEQFELLARMDAFMAQLSIRQRTAGHDEAEQIDGVEVAREGQIVCDDEHCRLQR